MPQDHEATSEMDTIGGITLALVGGVGGGKTSVAKYLVQTHGFHTVPDYMHCLSPDKRRTFYEASPADRLLRLLEAERDRRDALAMLPSDRKVALDRSVFCLLAHEYAFRRLQPSYACPLSESSLRSLPLLPVAAICILDTDHSTRVARCRARGSIMPPVFLSQEYNLLILQYYRELRSTVPVILVDTTDRAVESTANEILAALNSVAPSDDSTSPSVQDQALRLASYL